MEFEPPDWQRFTRPGFRLEFRYPDPTPQGHAVERNEEPFREHERVHLSSRESKELYLEVVQFRGLAPRDEYLHHKPYLERQFGADSITALSETSLLERPAWAYAFRWDEGGRSVLLLEVARDTYRIIYDPCSELNTQVIATLTIAE